MGALLIAPFLELKQKCGIHARDAAKLLIAPFLELKPRRNVDLGDLLPLLIAPFLELKQTFLNSDHSYKNAFNRTIFGIETCYRMVRQLKTNMLLIAPFLELKRYHRAGCSR